MKNIKAGKFIMNLLTTPIRNQNEERESSLIIDTQRLAIVQNVLYEDQSCYNGNFVYLLDELRHLSFIANSGGNSHTSIDVVQLNKRVLLVHSDLLSILTVCHRLDFERECYKQDVISGDLWRHYASADIDLFFVKYRSLYDNISQIIKVINEGKTPDSFSELRNRIMSNRITLGESWSKLLRECFWFDDIRNTRVAIEHHAAESNVAYNSDEILFKVSSLGFGLDGLPERNIIKAPLLPGSTDSDGFANFTMYAGVYVGYMISTLEELANLVYQEIPKANNVTGIKDCHPGYALIRNWITRVLNIKPTT